MYRCFLLLFCFYLSAFHSYSQEENTEQISSVTQETGLPYIQNYSPDDYSAFDQNWGSIQDSLGRMYFANGRGVLSYDGANWDLIKLTNKSTAFALASTKHGEIYVGGAGELGYLKSNNRGQLLYISLLSNLPKEFHDLGNVRTLRSTKDGMYFVSKKHILRWDGANFKTWENSGDTSLFFTNNTLFKNIKGKGLTKLINNQFELIPQGLFFTNKKVRAIYPFNKKELLIATNNQLFIYNEHKIRELKTNTPDFFKENTIYSSLILSNGSYAFGSLKKGILILNNKGEKELIISKNETLRSNGVLGLFQDQTGILWATLQSGISKIEYPSSFSFYKSPNMVYDIQRYFGKLYVGSASGLFYLKNDDHLKKKQFEPVLGEFKTVFEMVLFQDKMIIASNWVSEIDKTGKTKKLFDIYATSLYSSKIDSNRVFIGSSDGLTSMYYKNDIWTIGQTFKGVNSRVAKILESKNGSLWLYPNKNEIIRVSFENINDAKNLRNPKIKTFYTKDGVPNDVDEMHLIENQLYLEANNKLHLFNSITETFINDNKLFKKLNLENKKLDINLVDIYKNIWLIEYNKDKKEYERLEQIVAFHQKDGSYKIKRLHEKRIIDKRKHGTFPELKDSIIWYKGKPGIVRHDLKIKSINKDLKSTTIISKVLYKNDSLLFSGFGKSTTPKLPFKDNQFRFQYASPSFFDESKNQFQYYLEGFDKDWSPWIYETKKDYTNIPEGDYNFKVRSKNIFNHIGKEDGYSFTILPPWYRTWWMYLVYSLIIIILIILISQWRSNQLRKKNRVLEAVIKERTSEIVQKNNQLKKQTEQLKVVDKMKTRLFANISHEFRTPLTLIKGPIERLEKHPKEKLSVSNVKMIRRNANRLLNLVNQLLDLSKLESGNLKLELVEGNVYKCLRAAASSFSSHAAQRNIDYQIKIPVNEILWAYFDRDKLEKITYNLLSNAFKFSEDDTSISISAQFSKEQLKIEVTDSGSGILPNKLPYIFDRFYQVDDNFTKEKEGTGIGLALTKELIDLMNGSIHVKSEYEKGSVFKVSIPLEEIKISQKVATEEVYENIETKEITPLVQKLSKSKSKDIKTILIVEDNVDMRDFIKQQLIEDYKVLEAYNGQDGLEKGIREMPDLIISDLMMPKMDGISLCKKLKQDINTSHIPIILLTAKAGIENKIEGLETGADDYLTKPFNANELRVRVKNLIKQRQKLRKLFSKKNNIEPKEVTVNSLDEQFLQKTIDLLEKKFSDFSFGITQMCEELAMSNSQLHRKIKAITDQSPGELLRNFRLKRAAQILKQESANVTEVAYEVGFNNLSYFAKCFKEFHGISPSLFNKKNNES